VAELKVDDGTRTIKVDADPGMIIEDVAFGEFIALLNRFWAVAPSVTKIEVKKVGNPSDLTWEYSFGKGGAGAKWVQRIRFVTDGAPDLAGVQQVFLVGSDWWDASIAAAHTTLRAQVAAMIVRKGVTEIKVTWP